MTRTIKYRFWDTRNNDWTDPRNFSVSGDGAVLFLDGHDCSNVIIAQQYLGFNDKNGKEIYEGDIIRAIYPQHQCGYHEIIETVIWQPRRAGFRLGKSKYAVWPGSNKEVLGNTFENPEMTNYRYVI